MLYVDCSQVLKNDCSLADGVTLAQALLNQALIGPGVNRSFLGYLKYCLSCKIVSLTSVLRLVSLEPVNVEDKSPRTGRKLNALLDLLMDVITDMVCYCVLNRRRKRETDTHVLNCLFKNPQSSFLQPVSSNPSKRECLEEGKAFLFLVEWLCKAVELACSGDEDGASADFQRVIDKSSRLLSLLLIEDVFRASLIRVASQDDRTSSRNLKTLATEKFS